MTITNGHAEQLVGRAESLDPPGDLDGAQDEVVSAFELRREVFLSLAARFPVLLANLARILSRRLRPTRTR